MLKWIEDLNLNKSQFFWNQKPIVNLLGDGGWWWGVILTHRYLLFAVVFFPKSHFSIFKHFEFFPLFSVYVNV